MKEWPLGFEYSWADLKPIRTCVTLVLLFQMAGAVACLFTRPMPDWFLNAWYGGALATLPGFLVGLVIQRREQPGSLSANALMVWRLAFIAFVLSASAFAARYFGWFNEA